MRPGFSSNLFGSRHFGILNGYHIIHINGSYLLIIIVLVLVLSCPCHCPCPCPCLLVFALVIKNQHQGAAVPNSHHGLLRKSHFSTFYWTSFTLRRGNVKDKCIWTLCMMWILCKTGYFARYLNIKFDVFVPPVHGLLRNGVIPWHWSLSRNFHYSCYPWGVLLMYYSGKIDSEPDHQHQLAQTWQRRM